MDEAIDSPPVVERTIPEAIEKEGSSLPISLETLIGNAGIPTSVQNHPEGRTSPNEPELETAVNEVRHPRQDVEGVYPKTRQIVHKDFDNASRESLQLRLESCYVTEAPKFPTSSSTGDLRKQGTLFMNVQPSKKDSLAN